jgi:hypothetical protein
MMDSKARVAELTKQVRDAAKLQDPLGRAVVELVKLMGDEAKDSLVTAVGDDMLRIQGSARALKKFHADLTVTPPNIQEPAA